MEKILRYIADDAAFLYRECKCRLVDSCYSEESFGDATVVLESPEVRLRIMTERGTRLWSEFQPLHLHGRLDWFSLDLIRKMLLDEPDFRGGLDTGNTQFLREHFSEIEQAFSVENFPKTHEKLEVLARVRMKLLFGVE